MRKIIVGLIAVLALGFAGVSGASADDSYLRHYYDNNVVRADYECSQLRHECREEREHGDEGRACDVFEDQCGYARCERLRRACHEEREGEGHFGACHRHQEVCE